MEANWFWTAEVSPHTHIVPQVAITMPLEILFLENYMQREKVRFQLGSHKYLFYA